MKRPRTLSSSAFRERHTPSEEHYYVVDVVGICYSGNTLLFTNLLELRLNL